MPDEQQGHPESLFRDALFRQKRKHGKFREVEAPVLEAPVADTHAHLQLLPDPALSLARCAAHGVGFIWTIVDAHEDGPATFERLDAWRAEAAALAPGLEGAPRKADERAVPHVRIATGCHPHNAKHYDVALEARLRERLADPRVCALGEVGLDYHYDFSPREAQRDAFRLQIRLAKETGLPLILHVREAHDDALALLREEGFPAAGTLLHCYNLDWETLEPWLSEGCHAAFGGPLTFKNADEVRDAAARMPADRLLTETDAPYMTPEPMRGMTCGPEHVVFTAARLAEVRECAPGPARRALLEQLMQNARALLDRPPTAWQRERAQASGQEQAQAQELSSEQVAAQEPAAGQARTQASATGQTSAIGQASATGQASAQTAARVPAAGQASAQASAHPPASKQVPAAGEGE